jgi:hypothetical protein
MALSIPYCTLDENGRLMVFDYRQYLGNQIYWLLEKEIANARALMEEAGMWHRAITPARITGMLMFAGYTCAELEAMVADSKYLGELTLEAVELILKEVAEKGDAAFPTVTRVHPMQITPLWQTLSHEATRAILTMQPLIGSR